MFPCALYGRRAALAAGLFLISALPTQAEEKAAAPASLTVGMSRSVFFDKPDWMVNAAMPLWNSLVKSQTGIQTEFKPIETDRLGPLLSKHQTDLGVFQGYEFAWACRKDPQLRPLVIVVNQKPYIRAAIVTRKDSPFKDVAGLQGQSIAQYHGRRSHVRLYFERRCEALGKEPADFFSQITTAADAEDALDGVVDGAVQAAVVDVASLECYQRRKPGRFAKLKELERSPVFPDPVIAYRQGAVDEATLMRFREGMIKSSGKAGDREVLTLWGLTGFEKVPNDYSKALAHIAATYPAPAIK